MKEKHYKESIKELEEKYMNNRVEYATINQAALNFSDSFLTAQIQMEKEFLINTSNILLENAVNKKHTKAIEKFRKTKLKKFKDLQDEITAHKNKVLNELAKEINKDGEIHDLLLDMFDDIWKNKVSLINGELVIKTND